MRFKCDVKAINVDLNNFPMEMAETVDGEPEMIHGDAVVHFSVELETKEWGVKDILTHVSQIAIEVGDNEICIKQFEPCTINGVNDDQWVVEEYVDLDSSRIMSIYPSMVELDWKTNKAYVTFQ